MLSVYRRHKRECSGGHPHELRTNEFEERRKGWRRCECPIFASGSLGKKSRRQSTGQWEWDAAKQVAQRWERAASWDGITAPPPVPDKKEAPQSITIKQAIAAFLAEYEATAAPNTKKKYDLLLKKLQTFGESLGYVLIDQWTPADVRALRTSWDVAPQTAVKNLSTVKTFFEFCLANEWITRNPARLVKRQRTRDAADTRHQQKLPFSDDELQRMYDACRTKYAQQPIKWSRNGGSLRTKAEAGATVQYRFRWSGQDLADFISVSVYTGLRISDVATFRADRMTPTGEILLRTTKAGTHVYTWVPAWLQERIQARAASEGPAIFGTHTTRDTNVVTDVWRRKLKSLWKLCGPWTAEPTPHRFRHTFARILLQRPGVTVRDVAELLGNSEQMVRKHYAAWIPERQARLTKVLREAFADTPTPHVSASS